MVGELKDEDSQANFNQKVPKQLNIDMIDSSLDESKRMSGGLAKTLPPLQSPYLDKNIVVPHSVINHPNMHVNRHDRSKSYISEPVANEVSATE